MPCSNPKTIRRKSKVTGKEESFVVPCGKCASCLRNKQRQFAALALLEAKRSKTMHFVTLTYRNDVAPIAVSDNLDSASKYRFVSSDEHAEAVSYCIRPDRSLAPVVVGDLEFTPSLRREDVRLWIKSSRVAWKRLDKEVPNFVYAAFGEYGSTSARPHYHLLILNSTKEFTNFLCSRWAKDFGFFDFRDIPRINKDGSNGFLKVSQYVAKYIAKPKNIFPFLESGVAELPRRFASKGFGCNTIPVSQLKDYFLCRDLDRRNPAFLEALSRRRRGINLEGVWFPFPRRLAERIFYVKRKDLDFDVQKNKVVYKSRFVASSLSRLALDASRSRDIQAFTKELRENSEAYPDLHFSHIVKKVCDSYEAVLRDRAQADEKNLLLNLSKEKV